MQSTQKLMEQTGESLEDYLVSMRQVSDTVYYNIIKESDFSKQKQEIQSRMNLLYEANKEIFEVSQFIIIKEVYWRQNR